MIWFVVLAHREDRLTMQKFADRWSLDLAEIQIIDIVQFVGSSRGYHFQTAGSVARAPVTITGAVAQRTQPEGLMQLGRN